MAATMNDPTTAGIRTSGSNPSLRPISNRTGSTRSTSSHLGNYRHALLMSNTQRQQSIKKDLPVPPVLTDGHPHDHPPSAAEDTTQTARPEKSASQTSTLIKNPAHPKEPVVPSLADPEVKKAVENNIRPPADNYDHFHTWRLPVSKVRPAVCNVEEDGALDVLGEDSSANLTRLGGAYSVENHFRHHRMNTPKVRPFTEFSSVQTPNPQEAPTSNDTNPFYYQGDKEPRKEASYWGFLPRLGDKQSNRHSDVDRQKDRPCSWREPSHSSHVSSQGPLTRVPSANLELDPRRENLRQDEPKKRDLEASNGHIESKTEPGSSGKQCGGLLASVPPASLPASNPTYTNEGQESPAPQKIDTSRAARWFRGLLGYSETGNPPILTKLPSKSPPRRGSRDDVSSIASGVSSYSTKNSANEHAMNTAMHSLEQLITEALSLANEAGGWKCGHVDDGDLPLERTSETSIHTPSIHESIRRSSSEYGGITIASPLPNALNADIDNGDDGYECLPPKSPKRLGLVKSVKLDDKNRRPSFFKRMRKTGSNTRTRQHTVDDDCILPMPPPDRRIRRQSAHPGPLAYEEDYPTGVIKPRSGEVPNSREVREYIRIFHQPPISTRSSSKPPDEAEGPACDYTDPCLTNRLSEIRCQDMSACSLDGGTSDEVVDFSTQYSPGEKRYPGFAGLQKISRPVKGSFKQRKKRGKPKKHVHELKNVSLRNKSHVSIGEEQLFSLTKSARRQPTIARDWSPARKRFVASVACTSTALVGVLVGIYAGLVPSIQYYIADFHHYTILGNVGLYLGMALPSLICWPLPLLHGRKPYIVGGLCVAMPLLFPQAIAIGTRRSPYTCVWRVALLLSRALMGLSLGFASMNFHSTLTDLFGASLMSNNPHQEVVDEYDVRRHGGGLGVWLGIWTWCFIGTLSVGFVIGAVVIDHLQPSWGLYVSIVIIGVVLLLNVLCPEVRRSAWRRSVAEVRTGQTMSRRLARGEVMMHRVHTGPRWWGQEVYHGVALSLEMLRQPGFTVMAVYSAWIYAQIVLVIALLGSLTSKSYRFRSPYVGAVVSSVAIGAFVAIPFQKANLFSGARNMNPKSNVMTFDKKITWSSRIVRRTIFTLFLPIAGIVYTIVSTGPPMHVVVPCIFAALIGFLSCLAISECNGMLMEAWDCSDLQPGMTGRSKSAKDGHKRTNYSSFPRVTAGWNIIQSLGFIFAAGATGLGGSVTRQLGQREATGVVAVILLILSLLLLGTLIRFKKVQIIPECTCSEMDRWTKERRLSYHNWTAAMAAAKENGTKELNEIPEDDVG
ncbi:hypothetical protein F4803DRAFT_426056 [Xylaria telfairii]|nr:hypothetical protein F4803DRAFT_426056 [Xylaria telfairii]